MSYWDVLPVEIQVYILRLREKQALIDHRESKQSRDLCDEIHAYGELLTKWRKNQAGPNGHIEVKPKMRYHTKRPFCTHCCNCCGWVRRRYPRLFGYYVRDGEKKRVFLGYSYRFAMHRSGIPNFLSY